MNNETINKFLLRITILCLVVTAMALDKCNELKENNGTKTKTTTKIIRDTVWYHLAEKQEPKAADSVLVPVPANVDTAAILECYFTKYAYLDTLADTNIVIAIRDTISRNRILFRDYTYQIKRPQVIQNTAIEEPKRLSLYVGASAAFNKNLLVGLSPELMLVGKNKTVYGLGYDLLNKSVCGRIYWKLNK